MELGMYELIEKILWTTTYLAFGGTAAIMFLLIFAQSISGSKTLHTQMERLIKQTEMINQKLDRMADRTEKGTPEEKQEESAENKPGRQSQ
ncbi:MAG: hypothetical protein JW720_06325 [Sedimentisphaerales bacterium]|nr:hypothetical protein [Sedimentisphaerales bacterium]